MKMSEKNLSRRTFVVGGAAAAAAASLALAGCSGGSSTQSGGESGGSAEPAEGGALTAACGYSSTNVDPVDLNGGSALMLAATWHVFEGLYDLDVHTYETYPALAAGEPTKVSDTEYEVALREGAKFSDGTDVTADDVVNAFELNMAAGTIGPFLTFLDSVAKKDDATVTIKLKYPFETLLTARLSLVKVFPASLSEEDRKKMPIGSGPWKYVSINGDDGGIIEFAPNENYNGDKAATADSMTWNVLLDDTARTTALQEGTVQVMENVPAVNEEQLLGAGAAVEYVQGFSQAFLMFNCQKAPFSDPRVRQAIFYAIDTEKLINNQLAGKATAVKGYLTEDHPNYHEASTIYTYDPEKAKSLLAEAGVTDLSFTMDVNNNWDAELAPQIKEDIDALGMGEVTIKEMKIDWASYAPSDEPLSYDVMLTPGDPTCFGNDPDLLMNWWYGDNVWTQGRSCWAKAEGSRWSELQDLMQQAREATGDAQQELWNQCFDIIAEEAPIYALFHRQTGTGWQESMITGFEPIGTTGLVFLGASATA